MPAVKFVFREMHTVMDSVVSYVNNTITFIQNLYYLVTYFIGS